MNSGLCRNVALIIIESFLSVSTICNIVMLQLIVTVLPLFCVGIYPAIASENALLNTHIQYSLPLAIEKSSGDISHSNKYLAARKEDVPSQNISGDVKLESTKEPSE